MVYIVAGEVGTTKRRVYYTGRAGAGFVSSRPYEAFRYSTREGADHRADVLNKASGPILGIRFYGIRLVTKPNPKKVTLKKRGQVTCPKCKVKMSRYQYAHHVYWHQKQDRRPAGNPGGRLARLGPLEELRYHRDHGASPGYYKHRFTSKPCVYYDSRRNWIVIKER